MPVLSVEPKGDKGAGIIVMADGARIWTPDKAKAEALIGKEIPADWTRKDGDYGPQAFPPRGGKGGGMPAAFANTKDGQAYREERSDRRTALMQAVASETSGDNVLFVADVFYEWLRASTTVVTGTGGENPSRAAKPLGGGGSTSGPGVSGKEAPGSGNTSAGQSSGSGYEGHSSQASPADQAGGSGQTHGEEAAPVPSGDCLHPEANRKTTASGKVRCTVCGVML